MAPRQNMSSSLVLLLLVSVRYIAPAIAAPFFLNPPQPSSRVGNPAYGIGSWVNLWWNQEAAQWSSQNIYVWKTEGGAISRSTLIENARGLSSLQWPIRGPTGTYHLEMCSEPMANTPDMDHSKCFSCKEFNVYEDLPETTYSIVSYPAFTATIQADTTLGIARADTVTIVNVLPTTVTTPTVLVQPTTVTYAQSAESPSSTAAAPTTIVLGSSPTTTSTDGEVATVTVMPSSTQSAVSQATAVSNYTLSRLAAIVLALCMSLAGHW